MESYKAKKALTQGLIHLFLIVFTITMLVPFLWMVLTAFKTQSESTAIDPFVILPSTWHFDNFVTVWNSYNFLPGGVGSGCVHTPYVVDMVEGLKNAGIKSSESLTSIYRKYVDYARVKFQYERHPAKWFQTEEMGPQKYPEIAVNAIAIGKEVQGADAAIVTIGRQAGEGIDRDLETEFNLIPEERQLIIDVCQAFHAAGKPVVVIINSGSVIETASWNSYPDAIVCAWQPGEEGGNSVADILTGKVCPSGKLTMTWPLAATDHPSTAKESWPTTTSPTTRRTSTWATATSTPLIKRCPIPSASASATPRLPTANLRSK